MEPRAILVLYEPGFKLKNSKYLLAVGANIVGRDQKCQVFINSKQYIFQQYVANFFINDDFLYIEALCDNMVQFKSNIQYQSTSQKKKQTFKYIQKDTRYVLPIEQIFYIGPYKAIVQVQSREQLLKINNIINIQNFMTPGRKQSQEISQHNDSVMKSSRRSDRTEKIQSQNQMQFQPTLVLNDYDPIMYQPTIDLSQKFSQNLNIMGSSDHNLKIQKSPVPSQNHSRSRGPKSHTSQISNKRQLRSQPFSQQMLLDSIRRQQNILKRQLKMAQQEQFSMPDTIKDQQFFQQLHHKDQQQGLDDDQMPATIQDHEQIPEVTNKNKVKHSQTMVQQKKHIQAKMHKSQKLKLEWDVDKIQNMFDLFGDVQYNSQHEEFKNTNPKKQICKADYSQIDQRILIVSSIQSVSQKKLQSTPNQKQICSFQQKTISPMKRISFQKNQNKQKQNVVKQKRMYNVLGFKPTLQQRLLLKKRGLQLIYSPNDDYQILIIGKSSSPTPKFLLALMNGKIILTQNWLLMDNWKDYLQNTKESILGINWQKIQKQKQNNWKIFKGTFYLTQEIKQYQVIVKLGGGDITDKLDHRKDLNIILQPQSKLDKKFYEEKKHYKRWKFYQFKIIAESVMIGQFVSEKYTVDQLTF